MLTNLFLKNHRPLSQLLAPAAVVWTLPVAVIPNTSFISEASGHSLMTPDKCINPNFFYVMIFAVELIAKVI